jgi:hypothetical protein
MKNSPFKYVCITLILFVHFMGFAQAPQKMSFQAVIRNSSNQIIPKCKVGLRLSVLQGNVLGRSVYSETHQIFTDFNGLVSLQIGGGDSKVGEITFIDWGNGPFFIKTEVDPNGGSDYSIIGSTELLSVPYALFALNAENGVVLGITNNMLDLSALNLGQEISILIPDGLSFQTTGTISISDAFKNHLAGSFVSYDPAPGRLNLKITEIFGEIKMLQATVKILQNQGATGPIGPKGDTGLQGIAGAAGSTGANGSVGLQGVAGFQGIAGAAGTNGADGSTGLQGITGATGSNGADGAVGLQGLTGLQGITGAAGSNGADG